MTPAQLYSLNDPKELLATILKSSISVKFGIHCTKSTKERAIALAKINQIIANSSLQPKLLLRGVTKSVVNSQLIDKLNSNDSLYDGLFLVGQKAKNYLKKTEAIPHPIKNISNADSEAISWIFDAYSELSEGPIDLKYFKNVDNKERFKFALNNHQELVDYYLFGLHTNNSETLVNFVSTTSSPEVALNAQTNDKLIIFIFLPLNYDLYICSEKLNALKKSIESKELPVLNDSFYPYEKEYAFKGFILPHLIIGIHDLDENALILNPALLNEKSEWLANGLDVDQENFETFIKQTKYKRFLILTDKLVERDVS